jgi:twitching motility two-component system response regulator PilH
MKKILVVDDSPTMRKMMTDTLEGKGYQLILATDGEEALQKAAQEQPDLVLLDVVMPGKNGFQVCRQLKTDAITKHIKVIMVTSKDQKSDKFWGLKQGADAYVIKPFEPAELLQHVAACL